MEGKLKRNVSMFWGYQDKWFVLTDDGLMKQYDEKPSSRGEQPKLEMNIILAEIDKKKDGLRFNITSNEGQQVQLKATSEEQRSWWTNAFKNINKKHLALIYSDDEDDEVEVPVKDKQGTTGGQSDKTESSPGPKLQQTPRIRQQDYRDDLKSEAPKLTHDQILKQFKDITIGSKNKSKRKGHVMVAAIDIGSAYSGCAFSSTSKYRNNPLDIYVLGRENKGYASLSLKEPTVLLLNPEGKFEAFGHAAEETYAYRLQHDLDYANQCYYFSRFKMQLYNNQDLKKDTMIRDISEKEMKAVDVFAFSIEYIKRTTFRRAQDEVPELQEQDVYWVVTVPAIWEEAARQFMINAAEKAGIDREYLTLALEPEAAALCCKHLEIMKQSKGNELRLGSFAVGSRFLVVDLGGGTVDITSYKVLESGQLEEIHCATGGPWGGNRINTEIWGVLRGIFGTEAVDNFIENHKDDYLDMIRSIELIKRKTDTTKIITLQISTSLITEAKKINEDVISGMYTNKVRLAGEKLHLNPEIMQDIFKGVVETISNYVKNLLEKPETAGVKTILLVGGYASCDLLKDAMKEKFAHLTVICPLDPDVVVLKGAVIMGHMDTPIVGRVAKYHYGVGILSGVNKHRSFEGRTLTNNEEEFRTIIRKGTPIKVNDVVTEYDFPINYNQTEAFIRIYASEENEPPKIISENHCRPLGDIRINLPRFRHNTNLRIGISNNETEFKVVARDEHTGRCFAGVCRFLN